MCPHKDLCVAVLFTVARSRKQPKSLSASKWRKKLRYKHIIRYYTLKKGMDWYIQPHRWISQILFQVKEAKHKRQHTVWFHLGEILLKVKLWAMKAGSLLSGAGDQGGGNTIKGQKGTFSEWWNCSIWFGWNVNDCIQSSKFIKQYA